MNDSELDELSSQDDILSSSNMKNRDTVIDMMLFLLKSLGNGFSVARTLIRLGYEPLKPVYFHSPLALLGWTNPIYVYPNMATYMLYLMRNMGIGTVLTTGLFANASTNFIRDIFRATLRCRTMIWTQIDTKYIMSSWKSSGVLLAPSSTNRKIEQILEECSLTSFFGRMLEVMALKTLEVIISHPFYGKILGV